MELLIRCKTSTNLPKINHMARKKSSIGCLFWVALVLLVLVIFLFNRNTIETVLDRTGLLQYVTRERTNDTPDSVETIDEEPADEESQQPETPPVVVTREIEPDQDETSEPEPSSKIVVKEDEPVDPEASTSTETEEAVPDPAIQVRRASLFFVEVDEDGAISLTSVVRPVDYIDSPLTETLEALLKGLTSSEINRGLLSLIPEGTTLRGVAVKGNTAYIDFSESFRFNAFGKEGYRYQIEQVVHTATEFRTVSDVQITVEGATLSYLGPESPFVGEPLSRGSLL